jgi:GT2 family glycosyltransferase
MKLTSIVIPTYNALPLVKQAVEAIRRVTDGAQTPYEMIIVDNGSSDDTALWCIQERLHLIALPRNAGFPAACNAGLRYASGDSLMLLNNDVTVTKGWLSGLSDTLRSIPGAGIVGPVTNFASGRQQVDYPFGSLAEFERIAAEVRQRTDLLPEPVLRLVGFCMLFTRELYERVGGLDERFSPGHYEDDDFCLRARMNGYGLFMCRNVLVHHEGSASFKRNDPEELQRIVERSRQQFLAKWNIDPAIFI